MPADQFTFISWEPELGYFAYRDLATQRMLIGSPGYTTAMQPVEPGLPVPPRDGRWAGAGTVAAKAARAAAEAARALADTGITVPAQAAGGEQA